MAAMKTSEETNRENRLAELEERVMELEMRFTHQSLQLEELSDVLRDNAARLALLQSQNAVLRDMLGTLGPQLEESPDE
ncbi:SlyX family protein [Desulfuromonas sp. CSMB_57]|jgi:SlyX protein|uniref:SlyX family protein n=1 Tax=Desulfuromonas sp. CSMB_57 TaxID=2807629 RepID=UPI0020BE0B2C|nr:SlyX family protein [Desulfuromonas sp. CSMB_57]